MRSTHFAFTLVELLVVITIIVILIALIVPSMDKAVYEAELTADSVQFGTLATQVTTYAAGNKRAYPDRPTVSRGMTVVDLYRRVVVPEGTQFWMDDRPVMERFTTLDIFVDPMVGYVDLRTTQSTFVRTSCQALFFGAGYDPYRHLRKIGDRFGWASDTGGGNIIEMKFDVLASDGDITAFDLDSTDIMAHADKDGLLVNEPLQDVAVGGEVLTVSWWTQPTRASPRRGLVDLNYAHTDGSVSRMRDIPPLVYPPTDERLAVLPFNFGRNSEAQWPTRVIQLPRP